MLELVFDAEQKIEDEGGWCRIYIFTSTEDEYDDLLEIEMNMTLVLEMNTEMKMTMMLEMNIELLPEVHGDANAIVGGQLVHMTEVQL